MVLGYIIEFRFWGMRLDAKMGLGFWGPGLT